MYPKIHVPDCWSSEIYVLIVRNCLCLFSVSFILISLKFFRHQSKLIYNEIDLQYWASGQKISRTSWESSHVGSLPARQEWEKLSEHHEKDSIPFKEFIGWALAKGIITDDELQNKIIV